MAELRRDNRAFLYLTDDERNEIISMVNKLVKLRRQFADVMGGYTWAMSVEDDDDKVYDDDDFESTIKFLDFLISDDIVVEN
jgi:hypothetical protein